MAPDSIRYNNRIVNPSKDGFYWDPALCQSLKIYYHESLLRPKRSYIRLLSLFHRRRYWIGSICSRWSLVSRLGGKPGSSLHAILQSHSSFLHLIPCSPPSLAQPHSSVWGHFAGVLSAPFPYTEDSSVFPQGSFSWPLSGYVVLRKSFSFLA